MRGIDMQAIAPQVDMAPYYTVPVTIDGCFDVLPRQRGINFVSWHPLRLIIHAPIAPEGQGPENVQRTLEQSYEIIMNDLPKRHQDHSTAPNQ